MAGLDYHGKVALVTGAGNGMGRSTAIAFAEAGAKVVATDVDVRGGTETLNLIKAAGGDARFMEVDVSKAAAVEAMVIGTVEHYGRLDCAVNNAGIQLENAMIADLDEAVFDRTIAVNQKGVFLCLKYEIRQMLKQGGGAIVNIASVNGLRPGSTAPAYVSSKFGVIGLTRNAAIEYASAGIRVNAVCPGTIRTPMLERFLARDPAARADFAAKFSPSGRIGEPEEIAQAVLWLCSPLASYVYGALLPVDGAFLAT